MGQRRRSATPRGRRHPENRGKDCLPRHGRGMSATSPQLNARSQDFAWQQVFKIFTFCNNTFFKTSFHNVFLRLQGQKPNLKQTPRGAALP